MIDFVSVVFSAKIGGASVFAEENSADRAIQFVFAEKRHEI